MPRPIDADALVAKLDDWRGDIEDVDEKDAHDVAYYSAMSRALRFAKDAPTLDYAPVRHGEWIKDKDDLYWGNHFIHRRCSLCGGEPNINRFGTAYILSDYCPKCGAKMDGKE